MFRLALAFVVGLASSAGAQNLQYFYTRQDCGPSQFMFNPSIDYDETPLFVGSSATISVDGVPYVGTMMFTVNQDSGTWSMFAIFDDGTVCLTAFGEDFEPVTK